MLPSVGRVSSPPPAPRFSRRDRRRAMSFPGLIVHNLSTRKVRTALTAFAVSISVMAVITLGIVTDSLRASASEVLKTGTADFTVAQKSVADVVSSVVTDAQVAKIARTPGVKSAIGVLVAVTRLDANNPLFLEFGVARASLAGYGVHIVAGRAYRADAPNEIILGWQAAENLHKHVGDVLTVGSSRFNVVGIYSVGQVSGDSGAMLPLVTLQASERKPGTVTLALVRVEPGAGIERVRGEIERANPNLATVRYATEFGQIDRNLEFLGAAQSGARIVALTFGVIIVMNTMLLSFVERIREFGLLRSVGWTRRRLLSLVLGEAIALSVVGAAFGVGLSFAMTLILERLPALRGIFSPQFSAGIFWTALYTAVTIGVVAALYPSVRAAFLRPGVALRRE